jgi:mitogen-activated protein kinase kinase kinase
MLAGTCANTSPSSLTHKLVYRLLNYLETQLKGPSVKTAAEVTKWYTKLLENVRLRHRKLLRFSRYICRRSQSNLDY